MFARHFATASLLLTFGLLAGCGRAPGVNDLHIEERAVPHVTLKRDAHAPKAITVDGKVYVEGNAPAAFVLPEPAAPAAGMGHARVVIPTKLISSFTKSVSLLIKQGDEGAFAQVWTGDEMKGIKLAAVGENLAPGEYQVIVELYNTANGVYSQKLKTITVEADKTVDVAF